MLFSCDRAEDDPFGGGVWKCFLSNDTLLKIIRPHPTNMLRVAESVFARLRTALLGVRIPRKGKRFLHSWLCSPPTQLFNWYRAYVSGVVKLPKYHLLSMRNFSYKSISTLFQIREVPFFLKTLSYQDNLFFLSLGPFYINYVYVVYFRCPQNDRTHSVTRQNGNAVTRMSLPTLSPSCVLYQGRNSSKKCKYCPNDCDQKEQFYLAFILVQNF